MAVINSGSFAKALWPGVNAWYGQAYNEYPVEWDKLVDKSSTDQAFEEDVGYSGFGLAVVKPEGAGITYDNAKQGFTTRYQPVVFALGFIITREMVDDDKYAIAGQKKAKALAFSMRQTKEIVVANMYNRAFNASYTGGDGVSMVNASHPTIAGGTWSNQIGTAADLSEAALEQACIDISGFTNDRGLLIGVRPESLVISRYMPFEARRILGTEGRYGTDNNDLNAIKDMGMIPKVIVNHFLTDADAWFIRTNVSDGLKLFQRDEMTFDQDNDWDTENAKYKARERYSVGWTDPRAIYGSAGA